MTSYPRGTPISPHEVNECIPRHHEASLVQSNLHLTIVRIFLFRLEVTLKFVLAHIECYRRRHNY